jgi:4-amino-4-deoxy-L-arabinose transferase-like glycosyltransferase
MPPKPATRQKTRQEIRERPRSWRPSKLGLMVAAIVLLAAFLRLHGLDAAPPGLCTDEAYNGVNALEALDTGDWKVFYPDNNGREGLFINIQSLVLYSLMPSSAGPLGFDVDPWMLRLPSAIFGTLTVAGLFFLTRILWKSDFAAAAAAFFLATSFWHIDFSRIGFRAITAPFWFVWAMYFLFFGFDQLRTRPGAKAYATLALAGLLYGAGFHSYISFRVTPLMLLAALLWLGWEFRAAGRIRMWLKGCGVFAAASLLVALPLLVYFARHPGSFSGRVSQVSVLGSPTMTADLLRNAWKTALMFNVAGDPLWRHNVSGRPELFLPVGLLFLFGAALAVLRTVRRTPGAAWPAGFCLVWLMAAALPAIMSNESQPHALRALLMAPACFILAALAADLLRDWLSARYGRVSIVTAVLAAVLAGEAYYTYFYSFALDPHMKEAFETQWVDLGREVRVLPPGPPKYLILAGVALDERGTPKDFYPLAFMSCAFDESRRRYRNIHFVTDPALAERAAHEPGAYAYVIQ